MWGPWRFRTSPSEAWRLRRPHSDLYSVAVEETTLLYRLNRYARGRVPARAVGVRRLPQDYEKGQLTSNVLDLIVNFTIN